MSTEMKTVPYEFAKRGMERGDVESFVGRLLERHREKTGGSDVKEQDDEDFRWGTIAMFTGKPYPCASNNPCFLTIDDPNSWL